MKKINLIIVTIVILFNNFISLDLKSELYNKIEVKVGEYLITSIDIQNEIITNLIINKMEITQENIDSNKGFAVKNLINKTIKKGEINKYKIKEYNKKDLQNYTNNIAKNLNTNSSGLKKIFKQFDLDYEIFLEKHETELLWNTLIYQLYKNQTNVNIVEVENEMEKIKDDKNKKELKEIKENILNTRKEEKLNLFSRSHFSNLENTIVVNFQ